MIVTSNSLFLQVRDVPPLDNVGWEVRVLDHHDLTTLVAIIPEWVELTVGPELSACGAGSITLDMDSPFWRTTLPNGAAAADLQEREYLWEAWEDGVRRFQFLGRNTEEHLLDDSETRTVTISGPGAAEVLRCGVILRPGFPAPLPAGLNPVTAVTADNTISTLGWEFPVDWPAMRMWHTLFKAAQSRGTFPWVMPMFTDTTDSGGQPWEYIPTIPTTPFENIPTQGFRPTLGQDLLDFLNDATGQDYSKWFAERAEWVMWPGFNLDVRKVIGTHREDKVIFFEGAIQQKQRTRARDKIANVVCVRDVTGGESISTDPDSVFFWGRREQLLTRNENVTDAARRNALSQTYLEQNKDEKSQWVITVPYDDPGRQPFRDFNIGDWIGVSTYRPSVESTVDAYRVMAIVVNISADSLVPTVELTLQSKMEARERQLELRLTEIINKVDNTTNPPGSNIPTPPSVTTPVGLDPNGNWTLMPDLGAFTGGGGSGGVKVFIQPNDPGSAASTGDFWYQTEA